MNDDTDFIATCSADLQRLADQARALAQAVKDKGKKAKAPVLARILLDTDKAHARLHKHAESLSRL